MALFGNPEKKCILCGKNPGEDKHPAANHRFLCDKCAIECGYENAFFSTISAKELTPERAAQDQQQHQARIEQNKEIYKSMKATTKYDKFLVLDAEQLLFYAHDTLMPNTRTPIVYKYSQVIDCMILLTENNQARTIATTEETYFSADKESEAFYSNLPVAEALKIQILTRDAVHPVINISMMENELRKSSRKFKQLCETANEIFLTMRNIVKNNRDLL